MKRMSKDIIYCYAVFPRDIVDTRKDPIGYRMKMEEPYRESIEVKTTNENIKIGEIQRIDCGLLPECVVETLIDCDASESYVTLFRAVAIGA